MQPSHASSFRLNKWYLDCITDSGETFIGYDAHVTWKSFGLSYASCVEFDGIGHPATRTVLGNSSPPTHEANHIHWNQARLGCSGHWQPLSAELPPITLYQSSEGSVVWHCLQPLCKSTVQHNEKTLIGLGYAEYLQMSLPPWHLPIQELHWGRFLSAGAYIVWIHWRGSHPLTFVHLNGHQVEGVSITASSLSWPNGSLALTEHAVLRDGPLIKTVLSGVPGLRSLFPRSLLHTRECKWRSRGMLTHKGQKHTGWALHEIVHFYHKEQT